MSRLVSPSAFGLMAASGVFISVISLVSKFGLGSALVQRSRIDHRDVQCMFTYSVLIGSLATLALALLSPVVARVLRIPELTEVVRWLSLILVISSVGLTAEALLTRRMDFRRIAYLRTGSLAVGYLGIGVPLAVAGAEVWSLVAAQLAQAALYSLALLVVTRHSMIPLISWQRARPLVRFGAGVSVLSLGEYFGSNLDTVAVGAVDRPSWSRAVFPGHAPVCPSRGESDDIHQLRAARGRRPRAGLSRSDPRQALRVSVGAIATMVVPGAVIVGVCAPALVRVLLGPGWTTAANLVPILALAVAADLVAHVIAVTFEAVGRLRDKYYIQFSGLGMFVGAVALVVWTGPNLYRLAIAWLVIKAALLFGYIGMADARLGLPSKGSLGVLARRNVGRLVLVARLGCCPSCRLGRALGARTRRLRRTRGRRGAVANPIARRWPSRVEPIPVLLALGRRRSA